MSKTLHPSQTLYIVVAKKDGVIFTNEVNKKLLEGWKLQGGVSAVLDGNRPLMMQAMYYKTKGVKEDKLKENAFLRDGPDDEDEDDEPDATDDLIHK